MLIFCDVYLGLVVHSGALIFFGFWVFHLFNLLYCLMFPLRSQHLMDSKQLRRSVHLIEILVVLVCGLLPSVIIIGTSGYHYIGFPPVYTIAIFNIPSYIRMYVWM